jgi:hypothetical protein
MGRVPADEQRIALSVVTTRHAVFVSSQGIGR